MSSLWVYTQVSQVLSLPYLSESPSVVVCPRFALGRLSNLLTTTDELDDERFEINNYNGVGHCVSIHVNRISFTFDLRGPSLTIDTGA